MNDSKHKDNDGDSNDNEINDVISDFNINKRNNTSPEIEQLRKWAVKYRIPQAHLDPLLRILRIRLLPSLPLSSKTFLETTKASYCIEYMEDGDGSQCEFAYIGVKQGLISCINISAHETGIIELQINCDGLSLSKSSSRHIWPILCKVHSDLIFYEPFVVALYFGHSKPKTANNYLKKFILEMNELFENGLNIDDKRFIISIKCFICDTPARAFLKGTQGHVGFHACKGCNVIGRKERITTYPPTEGEPRTDASFRNFDDPDHHNNPSPLLFIVPPINMINVFILDFMHLGFLGVMSKLLNYWFLIVCDAKTRQSQTIKSEISRRLEQLRAQIPSDFQRKIRTLAEFTKYKATELKFFALYVGPIVLKDIFNEEMYQHFLLFHVALRLLWSKETARQSTIIAKLYLRLFCVSFISIYGEQSVTLNTHNLIHLADDVSNMGCSLSEMTAFPFENMLGKIKRQLRSPHHTIAQLCRRLYEEAAISQQAKLIPEIKIRKENHLEIKKMQYKGTLLSTKASDNMVLLKDNTIFEIKKIWRTEELMQLEGTVWDKRNVIYNYPVSSDEMHMWELRNCESDRRTTILLSDIKNKMMKLILNFSVQSEMRIFVISLLHE